MAPPDGFLSPADGRPGAAPWEPAGAAEHAARVAATIERYGLLDPGCRVLAAVSGGRDSTALALLLDDLGYEVVVGHVDHGIRSGSERDAVHCRALAARLGADFRTVRLSTPPPGEASARRARYQALEEMARASGASRIATGHTLDDTAETVAMRLGRGGAAIGIPPRRGHVVRPLIELRRLDTEAVCRAFGAGWIDDPTNDDERHRRNRLRRRAMRVLGEPATLRLAAVGTANAIEAQRRRADAEALATTLVRLDGPPSERCEIDRPALAALARPAAMDVVRLCMERLGIAAGEQVLGDVVAKVVAVTGAGLDLPAGMRAWSDAGRVVIGAPAPAPALPEVVLAAPGETASPAWGLVVQVEEVDPSTRPASTLEAVVDPSAGGPGLVLRQRRPGDRFVPLGGRGRVSLQDLFVDRKVPRQDRARVPVIVAGEEIVWLPGFRIGQRWKVGPDAPSALRIRLLGPVRAVATEPEGP
ncbi:MAG TPA: tRNA lysidine(34) synthetase TilS [Actinomycetota bacterium]|jgi:tRNA(Ile)-lysidine synthase